MMGDALSCAFPHICKITYLQYYSSADYSMHPAHFQHTLFLMVFANNYTWYWVFCYPFFLSNRTYYVLWCNILKLHLKVIAQDLINNLLLINFGSEMTENRLNTGFLYMVTVIVQI